jgi:hypothetical protein
MTRWRYRDAAEAREARAEKNRRWHEPFTVARLPWRVIVDGDIVAVFQDERDARGFALARYGDDAHVELRTKARPMTTPGAAAG